MTLTDAGKLGIGTTSPNHTLHVIGDINVTDTIYATANESFVGTDEGFYFVPKNYEGLGIGWAFSTTDADTSFQYLHEKVWDVDVYGSTQQIGNLNMSGDDMKIYTLNTTFWETEDDQGVTNWINPIHNWTEMTTPRAFDTTYTNNLNRPIKVEVTVLTICEEDIDDAYVEAYNGAERVAGRVGIISCPVSVALGTGFPMHIGDHLSLIVGPTETYSINTTANGAGAVQLEEWVEWEI